jgi:DNA invertase Pin-like site-specific DNA recombinase
MKKAILYARTASNDQQSIKSLDMQESELRNYCMNNDILVINCYKEICSGSNFNRPKWKALVSCLRKNPRLIDLLIVSRWDRINKSLFETFTLIDSLDKLGVKVVFKEQLNNPRLYKDIHLLKLIDMEINHRKIRIKIGMNHSVKPKRSTKTTSALGVDKNK